MGFANRFCILTLVFLLSQNALAIEASDAGSWDAHRTRPAGGNNCIIIVSDMSQVFSEPLGDTLQAAQVQSRSYIAKTLSDLSEMNRLSDLTAATYSQTMEELADEDIGEIAREERAESAAARALENMVFILVSQPFPSETREEKRIQNRNILNGLTHYFGGQFEPTLETIEALKESLWVQLYLANYTSVVLANAPSTEQGDPTTYQLRWRKAHEKARTALPVLPQEYVASIKKPMIPQSIRRLEALLKVPDAPDKKQYPLPRMLNEFVRFYLPLQSLPGFSVHPATVDYSIHLEHVVNLLNGRTTSAVLSLSP